jgi:hypothetical protein
MAASSHTYDVFISHKSDVKPWVEVLARNLQARRFRVFVDIGEIVPGRNLVDELYRGLQQSRAGILVVTSETWESGWVREEYSSMMSRKQHDRDFTIIPVVVGQDIPDIPFLHNVVWVDFRPPRPYREAFYRLVCALEGRPPGLEIDLSVEPLLLPASSSAPAPSPHQDEIAFVDRLFELFYTKQAVLLFAQADRGHSMMKSYLLERAQQRFRAGKVLHLVPPYSPQTEDAEYFAVLGQQCDLPERVTSATALLQALEERLRAGTLMFLLVSGFENTSESGRLALAGMFRSLNERYPRHFRILLCGGEELADLYYTGDLSFLNAAEVSTWPELTVVDVYRLLEQFSPGQDMSDAMAAALLEVSGGHPRLLEHCLNLGPPAAGLAEATYHASLSQAPFVWRLFMPFRHDAATAQRLCQLLARSDVSVAAPYLFDLLLRRLYWKNLLKVSQDGTRLLWRCEALRIAGRRILGCEDAG